MYFRRRKVENNFQNAYYVRRIIFDPNIFAQPSYRTNKQANKKIINEDWGFQLGAGLLQFLQEISRVLWGGVRGQRRAESAAEAEGFLPVVLTLTRREVNGETSMEGKCWHVCGYVGNETHTHTHTCCWDRRGHESAHHGLECKRRQRHARRAGDERRLRPPWRPRDNLAQVCAVTC